MAIERLTLLVVILLVSYTSPRPQRKGGLDISVDRDNNGNTNVGIDVEHKINDKTSIYGKHKSTFGSSDFHETRGGIRHTFDNGGRLSAWGGGNSNGNAGFGVSYGIDWKKKNRQF